MKFATWENVGVDRIGCAWLIRRFVEEQAEFVFIPDGSSEVPAGAEPFDIPGVRLSHHHGHCSFYALLREYKLMDDPILQRIARIIDDVRAKSGGDWHVRSWIPAWAPAECCWPA